MGVHELILISMCFTFQTIRKLVKTNLNAETETGNVQPARLAIL